MKLIFLLLILTACVSAVSHGSKKGAPSKKGADPLSKISRHKSQPSPKDKGKTEAKLDKKGSHKKLPSSKDKREKEDIALVNRINKMKVGWTAKHYPKIGGMDRAHKQRMLGVVSDKFPKKSLKRSKTLPASKPVAAPGTKAKGPLKRRRTTKREVKDEEDPMNHAQEEQQTEVSDGFLISGFTNSTEEEYEEAPEHNRREKRDDKDLPKEFDARKKWPECHVISQVDDQSLCASCWAVSLASVLTDRLCIEQVKAEIKPHNHRLSSMDLISCGAPQFQGHPKTDGCKPNKLIFAWSWVRDHGLVTGGSYKKQDGCMPYHFPEIIGDRKSAKKKYMEDNDGKLPEAPKCTDSCQSEYKLHKYAQDKTKVTAVNTWTQLDELTEDLEETEKKIMREIRDNGPVQASFDVYDDFYTYGGGVYKHITGEFEGGHSVRIIGWGEEEVEVEVVVEEPVEKKKKMNSIENLLNSAEKSLEKVKTGIKNSAEKVIAAFKKKVKRKYWLVANSWGANWGEKGFFKIERGNNECKIESSNINFGTPEIKSK